MKKIYHFFICYLLHPIKPTICQNQPSFIGETPEFEGDFGGMKLLVFSSSIFPWQLTHFFHHKKWKNDALVDRRLDHHLLLKTRGSKKKGCSAEKSIYYSFHFHLSLPLLSLRSWRLCFLASSNYPSFR